MEMMFAIPGMFELSMAEEESSKVVALTAELERLNKIGYLYSQTALDIAIEIKERLMKVYAILRGTKAPGTKDIIRNIATTIKTQNTIINTIQYRLKMES